MKDLLVQMINIYQPNGIDWMGYRMTPNNPYTFHHIIEKRYGGKYEIDNGAILTKDAHEYLNYLDIYSPEAYDEYQKIFRFINDLNGPIPDWIFYDLYEQIYYLAYEIECLQKYPVSEIPRNLSKEKKERRRKNIKRKTKNKKR